MNHQPQVTLTIARRPADGVQLWDRHLGVLAIWGSICRLGTAISQQVRDIVLDLDELGQQHGQAQPRPEATESRADHGSAARAGFGTQQQISGRYRQRGPRD